MKGFLEKIIGKYSDRELKRLRPLADKVMALEAEFSALSDDALKAKTGEFKDRIAQGETLDELLPEAFATVREAAWRVLGMKHFYVQILGGIVLHQGRISEMKTGEGKTLVSTLPAYLNALLGKGVHIVTVNDYLAKRDSEWMGKVFSFLGLTVGLIIHDIPPEERKANYDADITYGTNNEFGFDYLRDNMVIFKEQMVQRGQHYAIVDEVDSILIDEARTPLIISGIGDKSTELYTLADRFARSLSCHKVKETNDKQQLDEEVQADYIVDEKSRSVTLTKQGILKAEKAFNLENFSDPENMTIQHHINQAIRAHGIMQRDQDYVNKDGEIIIVDEFTGRLMLGRRYSDGLHQAIEAKEGVTVERESKTLATITFQNYFRLYTKLSGMTGTAMTEEDEFQDIYKLDVIEIPTNREMVRRDLPDSVFKTMAGKLTAVVTQVAECHQKGQPVLVGTVTIEKSEQLSGILKRMGIPHEVLNAKHHEKEAEIVAQAGKLGAVTIATNMAGRGTDIMLGGNADFMARREMKKQGLSDELINEATGFAQTEDEEIIEARKLYADLVAKYKAEIAPEAEKVRELGGLYIIGTERHESRRIDNQLRGRAGRQGDPGVSRFFLSLEDDLMRLFGSERFSGVMNAVGMDDAQPLEHKMLSNMIENAQKHVESRNFQSRKHVLQYDDVMNQQREVIYGQRQDVLNGRDVKDNIMKMLSGLMDEAVDRYISDDEDMGQQDISGLKTFVESVLGEGALDEQQNTLSLMSKEELKEALYDIACDCYAVREQEMTPEKMRECERVSLLKTVDNKWMDHLDDMHELRNGISLRAYAQRDPIVEYKFEGYNMFEEMISSIREETLRLLFRLRPTAPPERKMVAQPMQAGFDGEKAEKKPVKKEEKVGRNDPCPCGSGKKYKKCCGAEE